MTQNKKYSVKKENFVMRKRLLSLLLAFIMVFTMIPMTVSATESEYVYLSISFDGKYIDDKNGSPIVYVPIPLDDIANVDLNEYGLDNMLFDSDDDGNYETTALQLMIYAHEELYGGDWSDVNFDALPGSSYFKGGIFGFTENLVYFHNGDFPVDETQQSDFMTVGATSDRIVLEAGDFLDVASFSCYSFLWDQAGGFHLFADEEGNYVHDYTTQEGNALPIKLRHSFCDLMYGQAWVYDATDYEVFYGSTFGEVEGSVFTDESGCAEITFSEAGTYYVWCDGDNSEDYGTHGSCDYCLETGEPCIVSAPAYAKVTVTGDDKPEQPRQPQDVSAILNATMAQLADTVKAPAFGTNAGEWTVFSLARGEYFNKINSYFTDYYNRIVETVNELATEVELNGALDKNKSTENSRLIVALSAIGKDATSVGNWNLVDAYSANGINWIKKQGMNGTIWTLLALDSNDYETSDPTIRQQCVDSILSLQHDDGGWSLMTNTSLASNVDITGMALTALYPYRNQPAVAAACEEAIAWLSDAQLSTGGFPYGTGETSESCAWAIVALTTWGINPDTDSRFIKNGKSAVDNLLTYYIESDSMFAHQGTESNAMATDQACYALVAYNRFVNEKVALFDYSDVTFDEKAEIVVGKPVATIGLPKEVANDIGKTFNATIGIDQWDNTAGYKLIDFIINVPEGLSVTGVTAGNRLGGGAVSYNLEEETAKLRVVYFDADAHSDLTVSGTAFPAQLFTIGFRVEKEIAVENLVISIGGMSLKCSSDPADTEATVVVDTENEKAAGSVAVVTGISYSATCLYTGDDIDIIPSTKKAVAVAVTGADNVTKLTYNDGTNTYEFKYSGEIHGKTGVPTYVALVDASIEMTQFAKKANFTLATDEEASTITFGDADGNGVINAEDALAAVNTWLRKGDAPSDDAILAMNVNSDSRINTYDALGIVEAFVDGSEYIIITKAATLNANN